MSETKTKTIEDLMQELAINSERLRNANDLERDASKRVVEARNNLNATQAAIDKAIAELKKTAANGSDWATQPGRQVPR